MDSKRRLADRYELGRPLGAGGMGVVYAGFDTTLDRPVAIKRVLSRLTEDAPDRSLLLREARAAARFSHRAAASIYDVVEDDGELFIVMEYVNGKTLADVRKPQSPRAFIDIAMQAAEALAAAHEQGVVHRDIKPTNIMRARDGQVKVLDFGLARFRESLDELTTEPSRPARVAGTPAYMAPELHVGSRADHRADIFALGLVFYELLTGVHPFLQGPEGVRTAVLNSEPESVRTLNPDAPAGADRILRKMLAKSADERYETATMLLDDLGHLKQEIDAVTRVEVWLNRLRRVPPRRAALVGGVAIAVISSVLLVAGMRPTLPETPNLVVLPFDADGSGEDTAFARGLGANVSWRLSLLTRRHPFTVVPRSFVLYRRLTTTEGIDEEVGGSVALLGTVRRAGERVTAELRLALPSGERPVRSVEVHGDYADPVAFEHAIVEASVRLLGRSVEPADRPLLDAFRTRNPTAHHLFLQGLGLSESDDPLASSAAAALFEESLTLDPDFARAKVALARVMGSLDGGEAQEAVRLLDAAIAGEPELAEAHYERGNSALQSGETDAAEGYYRRACYLEPTNQDALLALIRIHARTRRVDEIERLLRVAIDEHPLYWKTYDSLATWLYRDGRFEEAIASVQDALERAPRYYRSYYVLGAAQAELGRWDEAAAAFERSASIRPTGIAYSNLGTQYFYSGRFREAVEAFEASIVFLDREKRLNFAAFGNLADALYWAPGERERAAAQYLRAIEMAAQDLEDDPDDVELHARLGSYHAMLGDRHAALRHIDRALELAPEDGQALFHAAVAHRQLDQSTVAREKLDLAVRAGVSTVKIASHPLFAGWSQPDVGYPSTR